MMLINSDALNVQTLSLAIINLIIIPFYVFANCFYFYLMFGKISIIGIVIFVTVVSFYFLS